MYTDFVKDLTCLVLSFFIFYSLFKCESFVYIKGVAGLLLLMKDDVYDLLPN